ncbi:FG-GAP repeat domain-containing protein [Lunatibacter salilacus]|uniref:FG-GAP repeat domain-containing protein n=1 Tax=Lunatibacter salilacus TaxID=2483804 RepID=UPI00131B598A|nr:VCBS repeat-containing protein [Lunatibacter salilacus]
MNLNFAFTLVIFLLSESVYAQENAPWKRHTIDNTSLGSDGSKLADVNGDGRMDLIVGWEEGGVSRLYINPKEPREFWEYIEVPSPDVEDAFAVDLDGDGFMDLVTLSEGKHQRITIHWAPADWVSYYHSEQWVSQDIPVTVGRTRWMFGRPYDMDGKNGIDLVVGSKNPNGTLGWLEAPENPRNMETWKYHEITPAGWIMSIELLDMDRDGLEDILISDRYGELRGVRWIKNPGHGKDLRGLWGNHFIGVQDGEPMFLTLADIPEWTSDGVPGIVVPDLVKGWEIFYREEGRWVNESMAYPAFSGTRGKSVAVADMNQNGSWDLVASYEGALDKSGVLSVDGFLEKTPSYTDISGNAGVKYDFIVLIDIDGDGDLDVLTCEETGEDGSKEGLGVIWYENPLK